MNSLPTRIAIATQAAVSYLLFLVAFLWAVAFLAEQNVVKNVDTGPHVGLPEAVLVDGGLIVLFALQHTMMARDGYRRAAAAAMPQGAVRSIYVLAATSILLLLFWQWRPLVGVVWDLPDPVLRPLAIGGYAMGWAIVLASTFMIDHFDLFGLRQAWLAWKGRDYVDLPFSTGWLYAVVRHPLMTGFIVAFWSTPHMTVGHLLFAAGFTGYILIGTRLEERDLRAALGRTYDEYVARVPMLIPGLRGSARGLLGHSSARAEKECQRRQADEEAERAQHQAPE